MTLHAEWRFELAHSDTLESFEELAPAQSKHIDLLLNGQGSVSFDAGMSNEFAKKIQSVKTCCKAIKNNKVVWTGPIWTRNGSLTSNRLQIVSAGWMKFYEHRQLNLLPEDGPQLVYNDVDAGDIAVDLLNRTNDDHASFVTPGTITPSQIRDMTYQKGVYIEPSIAQLSQVEAGFDYEVDPMTRELNIHYPMQGEDKTDSVIYGLNWGPQNLADIGFSEDPSEMVNRHTSQGRFASAVQEDTDSIAEWGLFEKTDSLSDVVDVAILEAFSAAEVALRSRPRVIYTIQPFSCNHDRCVPHVLAPPLDENGDPDEDALVVNLGDRMKFSAKHPAITVVSQTVRLFSLGIDVDPEGNEKITNFGIAPA